MTINVFSRRAFLGLAPAAFLPGPRRAFAAARSDVGISHSFLAFGAHTYILSEQGEVEWEWPENTRDGWMLPNGNLLLVMTRVRGEHGGRVIEVTRSGETVFRYDGTQDEVNTAQPLPNGRVLVTEAGTRPRVLELDRSGEVAFELALDCQKQNSHTQSRMTRKLTSGNYLVPLMTEREVREYTPEGAIVWRAKTPHWPFTAIRTREGNSLVTGTRANQVFEFDGQGDVAWRLTNDDFADDPLAGVCGAQRLANGNTVVSSNLAGAEGTKLTEVTRDKKVVWSYRDERKQGIHHFQILSTNGRAESGPPLR